MREGTPVVPHCPPQSPFYFSLLSLLRTRPHYPKACPGKGQDEEQDWTRKSGGLEIEPIVMAAFEIYGKIQRLPNLFFFPAFFVYISSKMLVIAFIWSVRKRRFRLLTVEAMASVQCCCLKSCTE